MKKILIYLFLILFIFSVFSFVRNFIFSKNIHNNIVSGKIVTRTDNTLQIEDIRKEIKNIALDESVVVLKGRDIFKYADLATGTFVFVELNQTEKSSIKADRIRIIDPKAPQFKIQNENK